VGQEEPYVELTVDLPSPQDNCTGVGDDETGDGIEERTAEDVTEDNYEQKNDTDCNEIVIDSDEKYCSTDFDDMMAHDLTDEKTNVEPSNNHVKRPLNAFMVWAKQERRKILDNNPDLRNNDISKDLGKKWQQLSEEKKSFYYEEARRLKHIHAKQNPGYKYTPKKKQLQKGTVKKVVSPKESDVAKPFATTVGSFSGSFSPSQAAIERIRRLNGFLVWMAHHRKKLKQMNPNSSITSTRSQDLQKWNNLTLGQQKPFILKAIEIKSAFEKKRCQNNYNFKNKDRKSFIKLSSDSNGDSNSNVMTNKENKEVIDEADATSNDIDTSKTAVINTPDGSLTLFRSNAGDSELVVADKGVPGIIALENESTKEVYLTEPDHENIQCDVSPVIVDVQSESKSSQKTAKDQKDMKSTSFSPSFQFSPSTDEHQIYYSGYYVRHKNYYKLKPVLRKKAQRRYYDADKIKWHFIININKSARAKNGAKTKDYRPSTTSRGMMNSRSQQSAEHISRHTKQVSSLHNQIEKESQKQSADSYSLNAQIEKKKEKQFTSNEDLIEFEEMDNVKFEPVIEITECSYDDDICMNVDVVGADADADACNLNADVANPNVINITDSPNSCKKVFDRLNKDQEFVQFIDTDSDEVAFTPRLFDEDQSISKPTKIMSKISQHSTISKDQHFEKKYKEILKKTRETIRRPRFKETSAFTSPIDFVERNRHNKEERQRRIYLANSFNAVYQLLPRSYQTRGKSKQAILDALRDYSLELIKTDAKLVQQKKDLVSSNKLLRLALHKKMNKITASKGQSLLRSCYKHT